LSANYNHVPPDQLTDALAELLLDIVRRDDHEDADPAGQAAQAGPASSDCLPVESH
jgi:hypothetical protein